MYFIGEYTKRGMFSVEEEGIAFLDDDINFSLLQTEKPCKANKKQESNSGVKDNPDNMITPINQLSNSSNGPQAKRFKFKKAQNLQTKHSKTFSSTFNKEQNDNFFASDEDDDLLSNVELCTTPKPKSSFENNKQFTPDDNHSSKLEIREINTKYRFTTPKNKTCTSPHLNNFSGKGSSNLIRSNGLIKSPKQIIVEKSNDDTPSRKFPGPAGNLPQLNSYTDINSLQSPKISKEKKALTPQRSNMPCNMFLFLKKMSYAVKYGVK